MKTNNLFNISILAICFLCCGFHVMGKDTTLRFTWKDYTELKKSERINRNGRMYDPILGHFLSPDPYIQMPDNPLNFNRYAYCLFNPLKYIDPSGKLFGDYHDRFNNYLGNDGINDGKVNIVTDVIDVAKIQLNNIFHKTTPLSEVRSAIDLQISQDLRREMLFKSIAFDTPDNLQEWGGIARRHQLENGSLYDYINWGEPGPVWQGEPTATFRFNTCQGKGEYF